MFNCQNSVVFHRVARIVNGARNLGEFIYTFHVLISILYAFIPLSIETYEISTVIYILNEIIQIIHVIHEIYTVFAKHLRTKCQMSSVCIRVYTNVHCREFYTTKE